VQNLQKLDRVLISKKHRGFFAKFLEILINELFSNGKSRGLGPQVRGPGPRVREPVGHAQSTVDRWQRGQRGDRVRRRAHRSMTSGRSIAPKLTGGGAIERGEHGELG
jgi:hypothetical protein